MRHASSRHRVTRRHITGSRIVTSQGHASSRHTVTRRHVTRSRGVRSRCHAFVTTLANHVTLSQNGRFEK